MKAWIFSDLHIDVYPPRTPKRDLGKPNFKLPEAPSHDVVIIAGDICERLSKGVEWVMQSGIKKDTIIVGGNHCFWRTSRDGELEKARKLAATSREPRIHILQDQTLVFNGVRFVGATLWTDYRLHGEHLQALCMLACGAKGDGIKDHKYIRLAEKGYRRWYTSDALAEHERSRWYIEQVLTESYYGPTVVITHHAPTNKSSLLSRDSRDLYSAGYASHLDALVDRTDLWIHGHIHQAADYTIGDGRVICNPRGYATNGETTGWNPTLVIDLMSTKKTRSENVFTKSAFVDTSEPAMRTETRPIYNSTTGQIEVYDMYVNGEWRGSRRTLVQCSDHFAFLAQVEANKPKRSVLIEEEEVKLTDLGSSA